MDMDESDSDEGSSIIQRLTLQRRTRPDWKPTTVETKRKIRDNHHDGPRILLVMRLLSNDGRGWRGGFRINGIMLDDF